MADKYAQLVELLETQGVLQFDGDWAEPIIAFVKKNKPKCNTRAQLTSQGGEAVEVLKLHHMATSDGDGLLRWMTGRFMSDCELYASPNFESIREPLMTVAQHKRILSAATRPPDQVADGVVVSRELLYRIKNVYAVGLTMDSEMGELRALLEVKP